VVGEGGEMRSKVIVAHDEALGDGHEWSTVRVGEIASTFDERGSIRLDRLGRRHKHGDFWPIYMCNYPRCPGRIALNPDDLWDYINSED